jgi:hypothetical protein
MPDTILAQIDGSILGQEGLILTQILNKAPVPFVAAIRSHNAIKGFLFGSHTLQSNLYHSSFSLSVISKKICATYSSDSRLKDHLKTQ